MVDRKRCSVCEKKKKASAFYKNRSRTDGLDHLCKSCRDARARKYRKTEKGRAVQNRSTAKYGKSVKCKAARARTYAKHSGKQKARAAVAHAVKMGRLPKVKTLRCADCGEKAEQYHHPDYSKPLSVLALCRKCHDRRE